MARHMSVLRLLSLKYGQSYIFKIDPAQYSQYPLSYVEKLKIASLSLVKKGKLKSETQHLFLINLAPS